MKTLITFICLCFLSEATCVIASPVTLTFDNLPTATQPATMEQYSPIPNGYGGLQWNNFDVMNVTTVQQQSSGYHSGLISPNNVAFNPYGNSAAISSGAGFDLYSAYLTSAFQTTASLEVQGFRGTTEVYDIHYTIHSNAPTLINFDYLDVNRVEFVTPGSDWFVMDNATVSTPDDADTLTLFAGALALCASGLQCRRIEPRQRA